MVNYTYNALCTYFNRLCNTGYVKQSDVNKVLVLTAIQRFVDCDFRGFLDENRYNEINSALYKLYGTTCLIPYPEYYNNKNKRTMYTCSISELANRVERLEKNGVGGNGNIPPELTSRVSNLEGRVTNLEGKDIVIPESNENNVVEVDELTIWNNT